MQGGLACGPNNARIPQLLAEYRQGMEDAVARALAKTTDASRIDTADVAGYVVTIAQGVAVHAAAGVPRAKLDTIVDVTLAGLASLKPAASTSQGPTG